MKKAVVSLLLVFGSTAEAEVLRIHSFQSTGGITFNTISNVAAYHVEADIGEGWFPLIGLQPTGGEDLLESAGTLAHPWMLLRVSATEPTPEPPGFSLIPAGTFTMGSPPNELGRYPEETQHQMTLTRDFYLQQTEVTNRQMADVLNWAYGQRLVTVNFSTVQTWTRNPQQLMDLDAEDCQISWDGTRLVVDVGKEVNQ